MSGKMEFIKEDTGYITKSESNDEYYFEGVASSYGNKDCYGDIFEQGSLSKNYNKTIPILVNHSWNVKEIIGKATLEEKDDKVIIKGNFTKGIELAEHITKLKNDGVPLKLSIGGKINKREIQKQGNDFIRLIKEADIFETSVVFMGANPNAKITKSADEEMKEKELINKTNNLIDILIKKYGGK